MILVMFLGLLFSIVFAVLSIFSSDEEIHDLNKIGSITLLLTGLIQQIIYLATGFPNEHITLYSLERIGEIYGFIFDTISIHVSSIILIVSGLILLYSTDYMTPDNNYHPVIHGRPRYYAWMYFFVFSVLLFVYSSNLLQMLVAFEMMSLACWGLISYYGGPEARRSSYKMLIVTHLGAYGGLAAAIALMLSWTGSLELGAVSSLGVAEKIILTGLIMWAAITKSSQFPTYSWLPDAMVAPTPTSALLHGATMIEMGPYLVARVFSSMGDVPVMAGYIVIIPAVFSLIVTALMYPGLRDGKRLLAYSTIAEVALMFLGVGFMVFSPAIGLAIFILHFTAHAFLKSMGFLLMGVGGYATGTHDLGAVAEYFSGSRLFTGIYIVAFYGLSGVPLYAVSKLYLLLSWAPSLGDPVYTIGFLAVLVEALVFLVVSMKWFNAISKTRGVGENVPPTYMYTALLSLVLLLYIEQFICIVKTLPCISAVI